ncbi:MAG: hypothetical protein ABH828_04635 [archaeon]
MLMSAADLVKGIIIGLIVGIALTVLIAKGVIPIFNLCPVC